MRYQHVTDDARRIAKAYQAGMTLRELAARYGCRSTKPIERVLRDAGVEMRPSGRRPITDRDEIVKLYGELGSILGVAKRLGHRRDAVRRVLVDAGVPIDSSRAKRTRQQVHTQP